MARSVTQANELFSDLPKLPNDWEYSLLQDLVDQERGISYGIVQPGRHTEDGVPIIRVNNIRDGRIVTDDILKVATDVENNYKRTRLRGGEVLLTLVGSLGETAVVPNELVGWNVARAVAVIPVLSEPGSRWIALCLRSPLIQHYIHTWATTTVQATFNLRDVARLPIPLPPSGERKVIAHILGTLDDKIELNRRMNETLEAMARAIFKSWFVDFAPVRAKAGGEPADSICRRLSLTPDLLALFPDSFQDSDLGEIPAGWATVFLGSLCSRVSMGPFGSDIKTDNFVEAGVPVVRGGNLTDGFVDEGFVFVSEEKADQLRNANAKSEDIVITHRGTLGQVGLIPRGSCYPRYVVSQSQMVLSINPNLSSPRYVFEFLRSPIGQHRLLANTSQVGVPAIARPTTSVKAILIVSPYLELLRAFERLVEPMLERVVTNISESRTLATLRDALLPKLVSGELRVESLVLRGDI